MKLHDGIITKLNICYDESEEGLAHAYNISAKEVVWRVNRCISYMSGYCARWLDCSKCSRVYCEHRHNSQTYEKFCEFDKCSKIIDRVLNSMNLT